MVSTIAVGVDGSKTAAKAVEMAVEIARRFEARVVLLSALADEGDPGDVLVRLAEECGADLLVVGDHVTVPLGRSQAGAR